LKKKTKQFNPGTNRGLWEIGCDFEYRSQLTVSSTVAISVSAQWLAIARENGEIALFKGGPRQWTQHSPSVGSKISAIKNLKDQGCCYTSLLVHNKPQGWF